MKTLRLGLLLPLAAASVFLLTQCAGLGAFLVSENDEARLGAEFDRQLRTDPAAQKEYPVYVANTPERKAFQDYVVNLAQSTLAAVPAGQRPGYPFKFTLIDADVQNAFAVPGGYVYIYTGIIRTMRDESELAGVLGHEIAHVTRHHYREAMARNTGLAVLVDALDGNDQNKIRQLVVQNLGALASLRVSRENESDADKYGTRYLAATGRNPLGIAKYFGRMKGSGLEWLSTHPDPGNRVGEVQEQVRENSSFRALAADSAVTNYRSRFQQMTAVLR
ncbi:MAG: peptidase family [Fibrobacteria bacterium]|jgi:predicted Zn-dependent protease|nr:peptidase family [Fibrobacteria bacterium]